MIRRATSPPITDLSIVPDRNVDKVIYGSYEIKAWYFSPYPYDFGTFIDRLYLCEYCLQYMNKESQLAYHKVTYKMATVNMDINSSIVDILQSEETARKSNLCKRQDQSIRNRRTRA